MPKGKPYSTNGNPTGGGLQLGSSPEHLGRDRDVSKQCSLIRWNSGGRREQPQYGTPTPNANPYGMPTGGKYGAPAPRRHQPNLIYARRSRASPKSSDFAAIDFVALSDEPRRRSHRPERHLNEPLSILFEDEHCLALDKPAGQFAQGIWAPRVKKPSKPRSAGISIRPIPIRSTSGSCTGSTGRPRASSSGPRPRRPPDGCRPSSRTGALKEYWAIVESRSRCRRPSIDLRVPAKPAEQAEPRVWHDWLTRPDASGRTSAVDPKTPGAREAVTRLLAVTRRAHCRQAAPGCGFGRRPAEPTSCAFRPPGGECRSSAIKSTAPAARFAPTRPHRPSRPLAHAQASDQRSRIDPGRPHCRRGGANRESSVEA